MREGEIKSAGMADSDQDSDRFRAGAVAFLDAYAGLHKLKSSELADRLGMPVRRLNRLKSGDTALNTTQVAEFGSVIGLDPIFMALPNAGSYSHWQLSEILLDAPMLARAVEQLLKLPRETRRQMATQIFANYDAHHTMRSPSFSSPHEQF